jgi:hypothetical protein
LVPTNGLQQRPMLNRQVVMNANRPPSSPRGGVGGSPCRTTTRSPAAGSVTGHHQQRPRSGNFAGSPNSSPLEPGRVLVVAPAALLHEQIPQPDGQVLYELVTGHPDRAPRELVFLADLSVELRAWPQQTWTAVGISPGTALLAVVDRWRNGHVKGLEFGGLSAEEARALVRPAMTYVRELLRGRLRQQISRQYLRWLHPTSRRRPGDTFLQPTTACTPPGERWCRVTMRPPALRHYGPAVLARGKRPPDPSLLVVPLSRLRTGVG